MLPGVGSGSGSAAVLSPASVPVLPAPIRLRVTLGKEERLSLILANPSRLRSRLRESSDSSLAAIVRTIPGAPHLPFGRSLINFHQGPKPAVMDADPKATARLLGLLYEGLMSPEGCAWSPFLAELCRQLRCQAAAITLHDPQNQNPSVSSSFGLPAEALREWTNDYGIRNPRALQALQATQRTGAFLSTASLTNAPPDLLTRAKETGYYDFCLRYQMHHSAIAAVPVAPGAFGGLSLVRARPAGPFEPDELQFLRLLTPHVQRALQLHQKLENSQALSELAKLALDRLDTAVVAVNQQARVIFMNPQAEAILHQQRGIALREGRLSAADASAARCLRALLNPAFLTELDPGGTSGNAFTVQRDETSQPLHITVVPFCRGDAPGLRQPYALIFLSDPSAKPASRAALLSQLFGLTPAECRLTGLLLEGIELPVAADRMQVTTGTARFMLKNIFQKTQCHRQGQLIRLLSLLPGAPPYASQPSQLNSRKQITPHTK
jgi:GAF domain-containing protein/DNA-binding CsgD family transcriptional regulator